LVHTDVTGTYGEFGGNIKADVYTLSVQKPQYTFPSTMVVGSTDMHISNVYNGKLEVQENAEIITAVPIDSNKAKVFDIFKTIVINRSAILLQFIKLLLFVGLLAYSIYAYKTNSSTLNLIVLIEYAIVLAVLLLSSVSRDVRYGKVTNAYGEPVVGVNVGLFEREFNKLQTERVTNEKGEYRFIIKPGTYEIRSLTPGYTLKDNNVITVNDKPSIINRDLKITNSG
ncbi:MAG: carboxypeptidase-like regulatory domain-containing protein, partial [Candidatus Dojkabacteria bacterium]